MGDAIVSERSIEYEVSECPRCGKRHRFALRFAVPAVLLASPRREDGSSVEIELVCPTTGQDFPAQAPVRRGEQYLGSEALSSAEDGQPGAPKGISGGGGSGISSRQLEPAGANDEYLKWVGESRQVGVDFLKTMITAASAAIPVYFAVLKYLGYERVGDASLSRLAILPPAAFLLALLSFAIGLRPRLRGSTPSGFDDVRNERLRELNWFIAIGTATYVLGIAGSLVVFASLLDVQ